MGERGREGVYVDYSLAGASLNVPRLSTSMCSKCVVAMLAVAIAAICILPKSAFAYDRRIALLIGLSNYQSGQNKGVFLNLPYIANDLEAVANALDALHFDEIHIYSDLPTPVGSRFPFVTPLRSDEDPSVHVSAAHVERLLRNQLAKLQDDGKSDLLLVYFTGHGGIFGDGERVLAVPESEINVPGSFSRVREMLNSMADSAPTTDKILVVDACADKLGPKGQALVTKPDELLPTYLYASSLGEASFYDDVVKMSVFTKHFVDALAQADEVGNGNGNRKVESEEIRRFVHARVPLHKNKVHEKRSLPASMSRVQTPVGSSLRNLILADLNASPSPPPADPGATDAEIEVKLRTLGEVHYGSPK